MISRRFPILSVGDHTIPMQPLQLLEPLPHPRLPRGDCAASSSRSSRSASTHWTVGLILWVPYVPASTAVLVAAVAMTVAVVGRRWRERAAEHATRVLLRVRS
jgi:hypothetical protein